MRFDFNCDHKLTEKKKRNRKFSKSMDTRRNRSNKRRNEERRSNCNQEQNVCLSKNIQT